MFFLDKSCLVVVVKAHNNKVVDVVIALLRKLARVFVQSYNLTSRFESNLLKLIPSLAKVGSKRLPTFFNF